MSSIYHTTVKKTHWEHLDWMAWSLELQQSHTPPKRAARSMGTLRLFLPLFLYNIIFTFTFDTPTLLKTIRIMNPRNNLPAITAGLLITGNVCVGFRFCVLRRIFHPMKKQPASLTALCQQFSNQCEHKNHIPSA